MRADHDHWTAPIHAAAAAGTAMIATTAAAGDLNDVCIHAGCWLRQRHGVGHTEGDNGSSEKGCCKN
jgi:hypothetical protein